jgi:hypothetical protein
VKIRPYTPLALAGTVAVIALGVWLWTNGTAPVVARPAPAPRLVLPTPEPLQAPPLALMAPPPIPPDLPPPVEPIVISPEARRDIDNVQFVFRDYRARLGANPEGTNAEIMRKVLGANNAHVRFDLPEGQALNEKGELLDRWGTPYFFHQLSAKEMEIRSAGPDRKFYTSDDIVMK